MMKRVVITGMGAITPLGNEVDTYWGNLKNGVNGIKPITRFEDENMRTAVAAQVENFDPSDYVKKAEVSRYDLFSHYAIAASMQAYEDAQLSEEILHPERLGVIIGTGIGGLTTWENQFRKIFVEHAPKMQPLFVPMVIANMAAGNVAIKLNAQAYCTSVVTACAAGSNSIGEAFHLIQLGRADAVVAGGTEAGLTNFGIKGFEALTALSLSQDPQRASIPFDKERNGFVMGEGAGILVLEEYEHARARGAKIYAEIVGYGATSDAYHMTSPRPDGAGASRSMKQAIDEAGITPEEVGYINAHGTSTPYNDKFETKAIKAVFGDYAYRLPVSSTKSMTGHLLGASGAIEAIATIKALEEQILPPTIGYKIPDEECDLDYIPNTARNVAGVEYALSNSLGFGGHNATLLFKRYGGK